MAFEPVIREKDIDKGGDEQEATQSNFLVDDDGNLQINGSITGADGGGAGGGSGLNFSTATITDTLTVTGGGGAARSLQDVGVRSVGGSFIVSGATATSTGGGGQIIINQTGGDIFQTNSSGGSVRINTAGDTPIFINSPQGTATDCEGELIAAQQEGFVGIDSNGGVVDGAMSEYGNKRASGADVGGCADSGGGGEMAPDDTSSAFQGDDVTAAGEIVNASIPVNGETGEVNEKMEVGLGDSTEPTPITWDISGAPSGVSIDSASGQITGTVPEGDAHDVTVMAMDSGTGEEIDSKSYKLERQTETEHQMVNPAPQQQRVSSRYGPRTHPVSGKKGKMHWGIDFASGSGTTAASALPGKVVFTGYQAGGAGNYIKIDHFDSAGKKIAQTVYMHLNSIEVSQGQEVGSGDRIGGIGTTGGSTGNHLHFEIRMPDGSRPDPEKYLNGQYDLSAYGGGPGTSGTHSVSRNGLSLGGATPCAPSSTPVGGCGGSLGDARNGVAGNTTCTEQTTKGEVIQRMDAQLDKHPDLDSQDRELLHFMARIESNYDPCAKNPKSTATGLYQMVDKTAAGYSHNRTNIEESVDAQVAFYKKELLPYYNNFQKSGGAGFASSIPIRNANLRDVYSGYSKTEMLYGLLHHDGVGNAQKGKNKGGVAYVQRRMKEFGFSQ